MEKKLPCHFWAVGSSPSFALYADHDLISGACLNMRDSGPERA